MKKFLALILALVMALSLVACGGGTDTDNQNTDTPDDTQTLTAMRHHLLNQKRTQGWGTAVNCVDAAFAILGDDHKPTAPTHPAPIRRDTIAIIRRNTLDITNTAQDPIWVGIYASYTQPYDKVESHSTELCVQDISPDETIKANDHHTTRLTTLAN